MNIPKETAPRVQKEEFAANLVAPQKPWGATGGYADTSEAAEWKRIAMLVAYYTFQSYRAAVVFEAVSPPGAKGRRR